MATTEVFFRNPSNYIREVVEAGEYRIAWDRGFLAKRDIDPSKLAQLYFSPDVRYRMLVIGEQGAAELQPGRTMKNPAAVYPVWSYGQSQELLLELLENPSGEDVKTSENEDLLPDERPVLGQEHRIVVQDIPSMNTGIARKFMTFLRNLQEDYPEAIIHVHGLYSYRVMFGMGFRAVDVDPRSTAQKGKVYLPNGKEVTFEKAAQFPQWVNLCGYNPVDLQIPRNRCIFNIKSANWAAKHYDENVKFLSRGEVDPQPQVADTAVAVPESKHNGITSHKKANDGDKFICNVCTIQNECKYFRAGAVCSVPGTEPARLANFFKTRDSDQIIEGLGTVLATQANRVEQGLQDEEFSDELDPEVTKILNSLFNNGVKLAKLVNPALNGGPKVGVFVNGGQGASVAVGGSASQLTAAIVAELESKGIPRDQITPEMIGQVLDPNSRQQAAIEAHAVAESQED